MGIGFVAILTAAAALADKHKASAFARPPFASPSRLTAGHCRHVDSGPQQAARSRKRWSRLEITHAARVRRKLIQAGACSAIENRRGVGYRLGTLGLA